MPRVYTKKTHCIRGHELTPENRTNGVGQCRLCKQTTTKKFIGDNPGYRGQWRRKHKARLRTGHIQTRYNLTSGEYASLMSKQENKCACCGAEFNDEVFETTPHVDHDHACCPGVRSCGKCVRGLLCRSCNIGLGAFKDDKNLLQKATAYLARTSVLTVPE